MLATFVIGLREGLEAALIVGIIAAFLKRNGTARDVRRMWIGIVAAILLCIGVGVGLQFVSSGLPQREQEMLECVIAAVAVAMVTFMILWMKQHSRGLKGELEGSASEALKQGSAWALVGMAFLAVLREGFETSVFLLAALQNSASGVLPLLGATLGIAVSLVLGWLVYRGALRFNLSTFFTVTSVLLIFVAAGLVMKTFRAAYEAGWLAIGQQPTIDLSGLLPRGSVTEAILGGVFGLSARPVLIEVLAWTLYAVPMLIVVLWPKGRTLSRPRIGRTLLGGAAVAVAVGVAGVILAPSPAAAASQHLDASQTDTSGQTSSADVTVTVLSRTPDQIEVRTSDTGLRTTLTAVDHLAVGSTSLVVYKTTEVDDQVQSVPETLTGEQIKEIRGRYPVGITPADDATAFPASYERSRTMTVTVEPSTGTVVSYRYDDAIVASVTAGSGNQVHVGNLRTDTTLAGGDEDQIAAEVEEAVDRTSTFEVWARVIPILLALFALVLGSLGLAMLRRSRVP